MGKYQVGNINSYKDKDPYFDNYNAALKHASDMAIEGTGDNVFVGVWEYPEDGVLPDLITIVNHDPNSGIVLFSRAAWAD